jgi:hypothetical protein
MASLKRHFINLGGTAGNLGAIRFGFRAPDYAYDDIASGLGVTEVKDNDRTGIVYGCNQPRPVKVRITFTRGGLSGLGKSSGTVVRFCEPDKLNDVLFGSLNGKTVKTGSTITGHSIDNVTIKGGR